MEKKYKLFKKIFLNILSIICLAVFQLSFISELPGIFNRLDMILVILVFILVLGGLKLAIIWSISIGFLVDLLTFHPFGINLVTFTLTILVAFFLLNSFFTNRSLYSFLALVTVTILVNEIIWTFILSLLKLFDYHSPNTLFSKIFFTDLFVREALSIAVTIILFQSINFISQKFKPVFLFKPKRL
jgi:cell shape-determining protein MreD